MKISTQKLIKFAAAMLTLAAVLVTAQAARAELIVNNVFYGWDPVPARLSNSNIETPWDTSYFALLHEFTFDTTLYDTARMLGWARQTVARQSLPA